MMHPGPHSAQLYAFAVCVLAGMGLGVGFDLYRAGRGLLRPGATWTAVGDVFFVVLAALFVARSLWLALAGEPRLYVLAAFASGLALYAAFASPVVLPAARAMWRVVFRVLRPLYRLLRAVGRALLQTGRWLVRLLAPLGRRLWPVGDGHDGEPSA